MSNAVFWQIYTLSDPDTAMVRYVGWTRDTTDRFRRHLRDRRRCHRTSWIKSLLVRGKTPTLTVVEAGFGEDWSARERWWIAHFRCVGAPLTNLTDGGQGTVGCCWNRGRRQTQETRARMSAGQMGHVVSPATRAKLSAIHMGRIGWRHTSESRSKISQALTGIKRRPESIEKHRLAILGSHHSAEARRKMSEQRTGKPKPHQRKLSTEQVRVIRESRGKITQRRLAEMFGITAGAVCMIQKRQTYQDLE